MPGRFQALAATVHRLKLICIYTSSLSPHEERVGRELEKGESQRNAPPLPGPLLLPASGGEGEMLCQSGRFQALTAPVHLPHSTLYRCTKPVTYTGSCVFAAGYAFLESSFRCASRIPGCPSPCIRQIAADRVCAPSIPRRQTRGDGRRGLPSPFSGGSGHPWRRRCPERSSRS